MIIIAQNSRRIQTNIFIYQNMMKLKYPEHFANFSDFQGGENKTEFEAIKFWHILYYAEMPE